MPISTDGRTLLFLDEIQAEPTVVAKLRWFAEELPGLPVIAAGSLLDFALREPTFSMPDTLLRWFHQELTVANIASGVTVLDPLHARLQELFICYLLVGGMPAAVSRFCKGRSFLAAAEIHADLLAVLRSDFAKYAARVHQGRLNTVFASVAAQLGGKFGYQACRSRRSCRCN